MIRKKKKKCGDEVNNSDSNSDTGGGHDPRLRSDPDEYAPNAKTPRFESSKHTSSYLSRQHAVR